MFLCDMKGAAKRRYLQRSVGIAVAYMGLTFASASVVHRSHPQGVFLYLLAALPTLPLLCFALVVGRYLREEKDEYQRDTLMVCMLWGTAAALSIGIFASFLHSYGWRGELPPFAEFMTFWAVALLAKVVHNMTNRPVGDE